MEGGLLSIVVERLDGDKIDDHVEMLVLAACEGQLDRVLDGGDYARPTPASVTAEHPPGVYLGGIAVEGFRGIGERRTLPLTPGPGLTLVVGRNGSGKSSFAEAAEMLFTGTNRRWASRPAPWQDGWRNLHHAEMCAISAALAIDGEAGPITLRRGWSTGGALDDATTVAETADGAARDMTELGWVHAVVAYRPFLSYNELGSMLEGKPSELHDAMSSILGLDDLERATKALGDAKRVRARRMKDARDALAPLLAQLAATDDERAIRCHAALSGKKWDLDIVDEVLLGDDSDAGAVLATLRGLASLGCPSSEQVDKTAGELRDAQAQVDALSGTDIGRANTIAQVLDAAIAAHEAHGDQDCPVCGSGRLDGAWRADAQREVQRLRQEAADARTAHTRLRAAIDAAARLAGGPPDSLVQGERAGVDTREAVGAWRRFAHLPEAADDIAHHLEQTHPALLAAVEATREQAAAELDRRNAAWLPLARQLNQWSAAARQALDADAQAKRLQRAERWLKSATAALRDERFRPIAEQARAFWAQLRQQSNVQLDDVALTGAATRRALSLDVSVDGVDGSALGVMSQGELHALALSLFLPRATLPESPFRFLVIDDPVQSMDPARIDGLARVLDGVARHREVVVFTHDDRLPEAVRRLDIDARVLGVTRRPGSKVDVHVELEPVARYLNDALALAHSERVPDDIVSHVVPGLCRSAIEAACVEAIRRRWLHAGVAHADIEHRLRDTHRTMALAALAIFDDEEQAGAVMSHINEWSRQLGDAFMWAREGAHVGSDVPRPAVLARIDSTRRLAQRLRGAA